MAEYNTLWDAPQNIAKNQVWNGSQWVPMTQPGAVSDVEVTNAHLDTHSYIWDVDTLSWVPDEGGGGGTSASTPSTTATTSTVADTGSSTMLKGSNSSRLGLTIQNDSSAVLYVKCGTTASATDYTVRLNQYDYWEMPFRYTGRIDGIWASDPADGAARITEFT